MNIICIYYIIYILYIYEHIVPSLGVLALQSVGVLLHPWACTVQGYHDATFAEQIRWNVAVTSRHVFRGKVRKNAARGSGTWASVPAFDNARSSSCKWLIPLVLLSWEAMGYYNRHCERLDGCNMVQPLSSLRCCCTVPISAARGSELSP